MNEVTQCCDQPALYYIWEKSDGSLGYEPWDFCPECLECCSLYDPHVVIFFIVNNLKT